MKPRAAVPRRQATFLTSLHASFGHRVLERFFQPHEPEADFT